MGVTLPLHTRRDPEHLRQTTQQRQGWNSGQRHEPGTRVHVPPSFGICPSAIPHPRPSTCCQFHGVFVFIFFMTTQFDSHQSSRGRHELVFLWKYYIYYIYFLQISQSVANPARQERENLQRVQLLLPRHVDPVCACCCWNLEDRGQGKEDAFKKDKVKKERSLSPALSPSLPSPPRLPPPPRTPLEFSLLESLGSDWHLNRIGGLVALGPTPLSQTHIPALGHCPREPQTPERLCPPGRRVSIPQTDTA